MSEVDRDEEISYSQRSCKRCGTQLVAVQNVNGAPRWRCPMCGKRVR